MLILRYSKEKTTVFLITASSPLHRPSRPSGKRPQPVQRKLHTLPRNPRVQRCKGRTPVEIWEETVAGRGEGNTKATALPVPIMNVTGESSPSQSEKMLRKQNKKTAYEQKACVVLKILRKTRFLF